MLFVNLAFWLARHALIGHALIQSNMKIFFIAATRTFVSTHLVGPGTEELLSVSPAR